MERSWKRAVVAAAAIGAVVGGVWLDRAVTGSVEYSIRQIRQAVASHDLERFERYVDLDGVLEAGARAIAFRDRETAAGNAADPPAAEDLALSLVRLVEPYVLARAKQSIEAWVAADRPPASGLAAPGRPTPPAAGLLGEISYVGVSDQRRENETAWASLTFHHRRYGQDFEALAMFRRTGSGRWRLAAVENVSELSLRLEEAEREWRQERNHPAAAKLEATVQLVKVEKRTAEAAWVARREVVFWLTLKNQSEKIVSRLEGEAIVRAKDAAAILKRVPVSFTEMGLGPGREEVFALAFEPAPFNARENRIYELPLDDLAVVLELDALTFSDGETIAKPYPNLEPSEGKK